MVDNEKESWRPRPKETPEEYTERVGGLRDSEVRVLDVLEHDFGLKEAEAKRLLLQSRSYWEQFLKEQISALHARGGSRYGAMNYVRRKVDFFTEDEIEEFVDSFGDWTK